MLLFSSAVRLSLCVFSFKTQLDKEDSYSTKRIFIEGFQRIFKYIKKEKKYQIFENITYSSNRNEMKDEIYERETHEERKENNDKNRKKNRKMQS